MEWVIVSYFYFNLLLWIRYSAFMQGKKCVLVFTCMHGSGKSLDSCSHFTGLLNWPYFCIDAKLVDQHTEARISFVFLWLWRLPWVKQEGYRNKPRLTDFLLPGQLLFFLCFDYTTVTYLAVCLLGSLGRPEESIPVLLYGAAFGL